MRVREDVKALILASSSAHDAGVRKPSRAKWAHCFTTGTSNMRVEPRKAEEWENVDAAEFRTRSGLATGPAVLRGLVRAWPATQAGLESAHTLSAYLKTFDSGHAAPLFEGPASIKGRFFYNDTLDGFNFESKRAFARRMYWSVFARNWRVSPHRRCTPVPYHCRFTFPVFPTPNHVRSLVTAESVRESIWIGNRTCIAAHFDNI